MNLIDMNANDITMCIDGKDMEMKYPICYGKVYDSWLVSKCGKVWSISRNKLIKGHKVCSYNKNSTTIIGVNHTIMIPLNESNWWGDGSGRPHCDGYNWQRNIRAHKMVIDTWAPLYDNPPEGITWEEWEIARDLPTVYDHISKTVVIDHIDDDPANNHIDNLRRVTQWDNQTTRNAKGI